MITSDTPVSLYLRSRGYHGSIPKTLRYHPGLLHRETGLRLPAMVAAVTVWPARDLTGIHRTYLRRDGAGKAAVEPNKQMLGPVSGGAVRLAPAAQQMAFSEGIETGLAVMQATGLATWAGLSAGGLETLILPPLPLASDILIAADNDKSGRGQRAAAVAAERWTAEGRRVRVSVPPEIGTDWADYPANLEIRGAA